MKTTTLYQLFLSAIFCCTTLGLTAQTNCGGTSAALLNGLNVRFPLVDTTSAASLSVNAVGLTNTEFLISNPGILADDGLGGLLMGTSPNGAVCGFDEGLAACEQFCITPFSFNIMELKVLINALFTANYQAGVPCCTAANLFFPGLCDSLNAHGIQDSSDVNSLGDLYTLVSVLTGNSTTISPMGFVQSVEFLNSSLATFGPCAGNLTQICYAMDTTPAASDCFQMTTTINPANIVVASPDTAYITTGGGTAQFSGYVLPNVSTDSVTWSIIGGSGATIDASTGLATATAASGTLMVLASAPNSCVYDTVYLVISVSSATQQIDMANDWQVLSNPFEAQLRLKLSGTLAEKAYMLRLFDTQGRLLLSKTAENQNLIECATEQLPAGTYMLQLLYEGGQMTKMVQKR